MAKKLTYIDLFAGAGGLSEGFIRAGYEPIAHVEMDKAACYTLKTRTAYHYLKQKGQISSYVDYLKGNISRDQLYSLVPAHKLNSIINAPIGDNTNAEIFGQIDSQLKGKKVDLIVGGPPCQAYSLVGRARSKDGMKSDPRNYLYRQYAKFLDRYKPKLFVFENVMGLRSANGGKYLADMLALFKKHHYDVKQLEVEADHYGVLQKRKRIILIGYRDDLNIELPEFIVDDNYNMSVQNIFDDLPELSAGTGRDKNDKYKRVPNEYLERSSIRTTEIDVLTQHITRPHTEQDKEIYRIAVQLWNEKKERLHYTNLPGRLQTHNNKHSFFDRFKVVAADTYAAQTVVAHIAKDGHYYIHPDINQNRSISVREAARLQSFPDNYYFEGVKEDKNRTAAFKQIGNAVPPLLAEFVARYLSRLL